MAASSPSRCIIAPPAKSCRSATRARPAITRGYVTSSSRGLLSERSRTSHDAMFPRSDRTRTQASRYCRNRQFHQPPPLEHSPSQTRPYRPCRLSVLAAPEAPEHLQDPEDLERLGCPALPAGPPVLVTRGRPVSRPHAARASAIPTANNGSNFMGPLQEKSTNRCFQCALGLLLIRRSAVAAGPIQQVT
jgi:hypothetical protein